MCPSWPGAAALWASPMRRVHNTNSTDGVAIPQCVGCCGIACACGHCQTGHKSACNLQRLSASLGTQLNIRCIRHECRLLCALVGCGLTGSKHNLKQSYSVCCVPYPHAVDMPPALLYFRWRVGQQRSQRHVLQQQFVLCNHLHRKANTSACQNAAVMPVSDLACSA